MKYHDWPVSAELIEEAPWGSFSNQLSGLSWHRSPMLILFCCCRFFKSAAKDSVLLLMKPTGFGLCWFGWSAGRGTSLGSVVQEASFWGKQWKVTGSHLHPTQTLWVNKHQCAETSPREALWGQGHRIWLLLSSGNSPPIKQRCRKAAVMGRVIPSRETKKKWESLHQLGEEAWLLRLSSLCFGDSGTGSGRVRGKIPLSQAAGWLWRDPPASHSQAPPLLLGYFDCSERLKRQSEERLVLY